jgi:hypothetical protein
LGLTVLVVAGVWIGWQVRQRVEVATTAVHDDARAAYQLYARAADQHDAELLRTVISGSDPAWTGAQLGLLAEDLLLDRWSMGLLRREGAGMPDISTITPTPDLKEVEVVAQQSFTFVHSNGRAEQATLEQSTIFRRGRERWLAARPSAEFWGEWQVKNGRTLTLIYPKRDADLAEHLLLGLEAELARACRELQLPCPFATSFTIRLDTEPASLLQAADPVTSLTRQPILNLPAPSLIGRPVDSTGERALLRAYAAHFIAAVIVYSVGWQCCEHGLFHQGLIDLQLAQLDLRPWPLQAKHYQAMARNPVSGVYTLGRYWHEPPTRPLSGYAQPQIYLMLDVLLQQKPELTAFDLQRSLVRMDSYRDWVNKHVGYVFFNRGRFQHAWLNALQAQLPPAPANLPAPTQDILLLCRTGMMGASSNVYRYSWATDSWTLLLDGRPLQFLAGLPGDEGVLLQEKEAGTDQLRTFSWRDGREQTLASHSRQSALFRVEAIGQNVLLYTFKFNENRPAFDWIDLENCAEPAVAATVCESANFSRVPVWSPDGRWLLGADEREWLWLRQVDKNSIELLWHGRTPFWLGTETFGYVVGETLVIESVNRGPVRQERSLAAVATAVHAPYPTAEWSIHTLVPNPTHPDELFLAVAYTVQADGDTTQGTMLLRYHLPSETAELLFETAEYFGPYNPISFSPDGRWLTVKSYADTELDWQLDIFNLQTGQHVPYHSAYNVALPGFDWSGDGRWLLRLDDDFIHLSAPESGYDRLLVHDFVNCNFAAWVGP